MPAASIPVSPVSFPALRQSKPRRRAVVSLSRSFFLFSGLMLFMGLAAVNTQANLLFAVFGLMIGVMLVSWAMSRLVLRKLTISRRVPDLAVAGVPTTLTYSVSNGKRFWPSLSITLTEMGVDQAFTKPPLAFLLHAPAAATTLARVDVIPVRRGLAKLERYRVTTGFPFGFVRRGTEQEEHDTMIVLPPVARVDRRLLALCRSAEQIGGTFRPKRGGDDEFFGLKDYRGESPRRIYWRRSAKTGSLVVKEMTRVSPPRIAVLIDTQSAGSDLAELARVEEALAMAASFAATALDAGLPVGLCVWSDGGWLRLNPLDGPRQRREILTAIARSPANPTRDLAELLAAAGELTRGSASTLIFTPRDVRTPRSRDRGTGPIVVAAGSVAAQSWFKFPADTSFADVIPLDHLPPGLGKTTTEKLRFGTSGSSTRGTRGQGSDKPGSSGGQSGSSSSPEPVSPAPDAAATESANAGGAE